MIPATDTSDRDIVLSRTFMAPRDLVWDAWTDPAQVGIWWGPHGFTTTTHRIDVRPGGMWVYDMHGPDGTDHPNWIRYQEVDPPRRLVYEHGGGDTREQVLFHVTVDFVEVGGRTTVTMRSVFPTAAARDAVVQRYGAIEGGKQHLACLEAHLAKHMATTAGNVSYATDHATFTTARDLPASMEDVFAAISDPERLARWWGPAGFTNIVTTCEFRKNGRWLFTMHGPDGRNHPNENIFLDIEAPHRVVIQHVGAPRKTLTITLAATATGTRIAWNQWFESAEVAKRIEHIILPANEQNLDRLTIEVLRHDEDARDIAG